MSEGERFPTLYIPHGGGPCFFMEPAFGPKDTWDAMAAYLRGIGRAVGRRPKAVLVISGHWEEPEPTVNTAANPPLLFDYYGFPEHTYRLTYPAPGSPALAARARELLGQAGMASGEEAARGLDHGVFVPFLLIYPDASVPMVQLSLAADLDAAHHLAIGRALAKLREEDVLIVGSGMSYHNLRAFAAAGGRADADSAAFDSWLAETVADPDSSSRDRRLAAWTQAPAAFACHPRPEHLVPLFVAAGAADGDRGRRTFSGKVWGKAVSGFQFG
jgi:aromatic ring-opening dioxygenase catalytic subunit (LigB family)